MRRILVLVVTSLLWLSGAAAARPHHRHHAARSHRAVKHAARHHRSGTWKGTFRQCSHGHCRRVAIFQGHNAARSSLRTEPLDRPSGEIWIRAENLNEEVKVNIYKPDGRFDEAALAKLDALFRCVRTGEVRAVRPQLYEQLSRIYDHFDHKRVSLVSGFRFAERNSSRHYHASAMDIRVPGVPIKQVYDFAATLDAGGMGLGIYPTTGFIHFDYRAPGEPSYRWVDYSGHGGRKPGHHKHKSHHHRHHPRKPVS